MQHRLSSLLVSGLIATAAVGCGGYDSYSPPAPNDTASVAGGYRATLITYTSDQSTTDLMAFGLSFEATLSDSGTMTGQFVISPGNGRPGNPFPISGKWSRQAAILTITDDQQSFIGKLNFVVLPGRLEGLGVVGQSTIRMELERRAG